MNYEFAATALKKIADTQDLMIPLNYPKPPDLEQKRKELEEAITLLKLSSLGGFAELVSLVRQWGEDKGITGPNAKATTQTQFVKLLEEVEELNVAIAVPDHDEIVDAIGDCTVVLILLADLAGVRFEDCLLSAYNVIKNRTGKIVDGAFVKDSPSDDDFNEPLPERTCTDGDVCESCQ